MINLRYEDGENGKLHFRLLISLMLDKVDDR